MIYNPWKIFPEDPRLTPITETHAKRRLQAKTVRLLIISSLIVIAVVLFFVSSSVTRVSRACAVIDTLLETGEWNSQDRIRILSMNRRAEELFFSNYRDPEILAAALLLDLRNEKALAELFLGSLPADGTPLALWGRTLLLEQWAAQGRWNRMAAYTSERILAGETAPALWDRYAESLWKGDLNPSKYEAPAFRGESPWEIPLIHERGDLNREQYIRFLLTHDLASLNEVLQNWQFPGAEDDLGQRILRARGMAQEKRYGEAETLLRDLWEEELAGYPRLPDLFLAEVRDVVRRSGRERDWVPLLEEWEAAEDSFYAAFFTATVYEGAGETSRAGDFYRTAAEGAPDMLRKNRAQWYELRLLIRQQPEEVPEFLAAHGPHWGTTDYFDDLLDEYYSLLVRTRAWTALEATVSHLRHTALEGPLRQGLFLLERAVEGELLTPPAFLDEASLRQRAQNGLDYYSLMPGSRNWAGTKTEEPPSHSVLLTPAEEALEEVYRILLEAGEFEASLALWNHRQDPLSYETVEMICRRFHQEERFYEGIRFSGYWFYRWPVSAAVGLIPWLYPVDPRLPVAEYSREHGLTEEIVLGIIRRESAFQQTAVSHAGAVGLMQLMPATASDLASRHRIGSWDLNNPRDNIRFGSLYLNWLEDRPWTGTYADVLAAYNGGGGNLRRWKRQFGDLDQQLFIQGIPFSETRNYIRKVIVAAGSYRYLNTGEPPGEWIDQFFSPFPVL